MAGHPQGVLQGIPHSRSKRTKQALKSPRASQPALPAAFLQRKTLRPELCAANFRQGFRKLHVPTVASLSVLRLCGESFACTQLRPMRVPLFGHSVSYVADSRPPRAHHTFPHSVATPKDGSSPRCARTRPRCAVRTGASMRVNTVLAPALQAMHTDKLASHSSYDHKTKLEFITFDCTATRRNSPSMRRPTSARDCALETRTPPLTEVSWHRNIGRKRHQRLRGLEGCLLPVATANALGMALVELLTTSSSAPAASAGLASNWHSRLLSASSRAAEAVEGLVEGRSRAFRRANAPT